jgi:cell division protein FtsX
MRKSITILMAMLVAVGLLASFAGPVAAHDTEAEVENDADIDNDIDQDQDIDQDNEQNGAAVAFYGDADVDQDSDQDADQDQRAANVNKVAQDALAAALSVDA